MTPEHPAAAAWEAYEQSQAFAYHRGTKALQRAFLAGWEALRSEIVRAPIIDDEGGCSPNNYGGRG